MAAEPRYQPIPVITVPERRWQEHMILLLKHWLCQASKLSLALQTFQNVSPFLSGSIQVKTQLAQTSQHITKSSWRLWASQWVEVALM